MNIPILTTDRLILRGFTLDDFPAYAASRADPAVMAQMAGGGTLTEEEAWAAFLKIPGSWYLLGFGSWAITDRKTGAVIGDVGFIERKRDRGPDLRGVPEMGWALIPSRFGKGYATEAVEAVLNWGRQALGPVRVIALTSENNFASMRVAEKCGFTEFRRALSAGRPRVFFDRVL